LQVELCDLCLSPLEVVTTMRYTNRRILYFTRDNRYRKWVPDRHRSDENHVLQTQS